MFWYILGGIIQTFITGFGFISSPQVTSEQLVMLLELLLEEEELSKEAMEALQRAYNLQQQDAEVRPHTHTHTRSLTHPWRQPSIYVPAP